MASGKEAARPIPCEEEGAARPYPLPGPAEAAGAGVLTGPGRGYRRCPGKSEGMAISGSPPLRVPGAEASNAQSLDPGNDCPQRHNKKVAAFARFTRSGEHGSESRAGNFWTLWEIGGNIAGTERRRRSRSRYSGNPILAGATKWQA